ncbi:MAG: thiamine phosphate synthase, partial [Prevotella sp.]|nr:thiamine phosphate synthase [Prevotella sp.]
MKWIVITSPDFVSGEALFIDRLFGHGLDLLHLRKPGSTIEACRELLRQIPERWHSRIVLHDHFPLTGEFLLHGVHLNRRCPH